MQYVAEHPVRQFQVMQWSIRKAAALGQALRTAHQIRAVTDPPRLFAAAPGAVFGVKQIEDLVCQILEVRSVYRKVTLPLSLAAVRIRITRSLTIWYAESAQCPGYCQS